MFRQMYMREAILSVAVQRFIFDYKRKLNCLDVIGALPPSKRARAPAPPEKRALAPPVVVPHRKGRQAKVRSKRSKKSKGDARVWRKGPKPVDPFNEIMPRGQRSVAVCKEDFFEGTAKVGYLNRIKPFSGASNNVQALDVVTEQMAEMSIEAPNESTELESEVLHCPKGVCIQDFQKLKAEGALKNRQFKKRLSDAVLNLTETTTPALDNIKEMGVMNLTDDTKECTREPESKLMVPKVDMTSEKQQTPQTPQTPQKQASNVDTNKMKSRKRNRKRNKSYIREKENTLDCPVSTDLAARDAPKTDADLDTGARIDPEVDVDSNEKPKTLEAKDEIGIAASQSESLPVEEAECGTEEKDPQMASKAIQSHALPL